MDFLQDTLQIDAATVTAFFVIAAGIAAVLQLAKEWLRMLVPAVSKYPAWERQGIRTVATLLGSAAMMGYLGSFGWLEASLGALAGMSSESVYRWFIAELKRRTKAAA
jgi:hypothetical protein